MREDRVGIRCLLLGIFLGWAANMFFRHYEAVWDRDAIYEQGYEDGYDFGEKAKVQELIEWKKANFKIIEYRDSLNEH